MLPPNLANTLRAVDEARRTPADALAAAQRSTAASVRRIGRSQQHWSRQADEIRRRNPEMWRRAQHMPATSVPSLLEVARRPKLSRHLPQRVRAELGLLTAPRARASRSRSARCRGSRRASSATRAPPGDDPPGESAERLCLGCSEPLVGKRPQALYHDDACRKRYERRDLEERTCASCATLLSRFNSGAVCWACEWASLAVETDEPAEVELFPELTDDEFDRRCEALSNAPILEAAA